MGMITKITQMLDLISRSGYDIKACNIDQQTGMETIAEKNNG